MKNNLRYADWHILASRFKQIISRLEGERKDSINLSFFEKGFWCRTTISQFGSYESQPDCGNCPLWIRLQKEKTYLCNCNLKTDSILSRFVHALKNQEQEKALENAKIFYQYLLKNCPDENKAKKDGFYLNPGYTKKETINYLTSKGWPRLGNFLAKILFD